MTHAKGGLQEAKARLKLYLTAAATEEAKAAADYEQAAALAREAGDVVVAALLTNIARDEGRHADLLRTAMAKYAHV